MIKRKLERAEHQEKTLNLFNNINYNLKMKEKK